MQGKKGITGVLSSEPADSDSGSQRLKTSMFSKFLQLLHPKSWTL